MGGFLSTPSVLPSHLLSFKGLLSSGKSLQAQNSDAAAQPLQDRGQRAALLCQTRMENILLQP